MLASDVLGPYGDSELIPLADIADRVGLNRGTQNYAIRHNVITPAPKRGPHGRYLVTRDEALLILAAAAIAVAVGAALVTVLRTLRDSGASITPEGLTIPVTIPGTGA